MSEFGYGSRFDQSQPVDPLVYERIGQLEAENADLRKKVRRYNRGSWVLGILLLLVWGVPFVLGVTAALSQ
ncbi:hypothetical protein LJN51_08125 [Cellulomonas sp. zg-B12]|nr:hypothetical protein [Cellulomonas xiejunii]